MGPLFGIARHTGHSKSSRNSSDDWMPFLLGILEIDPKINKRLNFSLIFYDIDSSSVTVKCFQTILQTDAIRRKVTSRKQPLMSIFSLVSHYTFIFKVNISILILAPKSTIIICKYKFGHFLARRKFNYL